MGNDGHRTARQTCYTGAQPGRAGAPPDRSHTTPRTSARQRRQAFDTQEERSRTGRQAEAGKPKAQSPPSPHTHPSTQADGRGGGFSNQQPTTYHTIAAQHSLDLPTPTCARSSKMCTALHCSAPHRTQLPAHAHAPLLPTADSRQKAGAPRPRSLVSQGRREGHIYGGSGARRRRLMWLCL